MQVDAAKIEIALMNADVSDFSRIDIITKLTNQGLPQEAVTRMDSLWNKTKIIAGESIQIGKIIIVKILEFVEANPNMAIGMAVGAAIGALVNLIPFIGPLLSPITISLGAIGGGLIGHRLDKKDQGSSVSDSKTDYAESLITMAKEFFKLIAEIFNALKAYFADSF